MSLFPIKESIKNDLSSLNKERASEILMIALEKDATRAFIEDNICIQDYELVSDEAIRLFQEFQNLTISEEIQSIEEGIELVKSELLDPAAVLIEGVSKFKGVFNPERTFKEFKTMLTQPNSQI